MIMELGVYQVLIIENNQEKTHLEGRWVQVSYLQDKIVMFLISRDISKMLTRKRWKFQCVYYPLSQDSYSTLSSSSARWTCQIFSGSITGIYSRGGATSRRKEAGESSIWCTETCFSFFPFLYSYKISLFFWSSFVKTSGAWHMFSSSVNMSKGYLTFALGIFCSVLRAPSEEGTQHGRKISFEILLMLLLAVSRYAKMEALCWKQINTLVLCLVKA